jgi:hypothetical protein
VSQDTAPHPSSLPDPGTEIRCRHTPAAAVNEFAFEEMALAHAQDLLGQVPADDPLRDDIQDAIESTQAECLGAVGQHAEAHRLQERLGEAPVLNRQALLGRIARQQGLSNQVVTEYECRRFAEALAAFPGWVAAGERLLEEARAGAAEAGQDLVRAALLLLSGDLANWAALLTDLADYLEFPENLLRERDPDALPRRRWQRCCRTTKSGARNTACARRPWRC